MSKIELKILRIETGEVLIAEFEDADAAKQWLVERPTNVEVLRMISSVDPALEAELRAAMRPFDDAEQELRDARMAEQMLGAAGSEEPEAAEDVDPGRAMGVRWELGKGMWVIDEGDDREINDTVREAVLAWIDERNSWVRDRDEHVCGAVVTVWPLEIPEEYGSDRILPGGTFVKSAGAAPTN